MTEPTEVARLRRRVERQCLAARRNECAARSRRQGRSQARLFGHARPPSLGTVYCVVVSNTAALLANSLDVCYSFPHPFCQTQFRSRSEGFMPKTDAGIDKYIAKANDFARPILTRLRETVHAACPDCEEA